MNKKISIIVVVLAVLALVYWLSTVKPVGYGTPEGTQNETQESTQVSVVEKGPLGIATGAVGQYLVDKSGLTLYVKVSDAAANTSSIKTSCNAECEKTWLPYLLGAEEGGITESNDALLSKLNLFTRSDSKQQYALGNQPLYRNTNDSKLGDQNGNVSSDWMVAKP